MSGNGLQAALVKENEKHLSEVKQKKGRIQEKVSTLQKVISDLEDEEKFRTQTLEWLKEPERGEQRKAATQPDKIRQAMSPAPTRLSTASVAGSYASRGSMRNLIPKFTHSATISTGGSLGVTTTQSASSSSTWVLRTTHGEDGDHLTRYPTIIRDPRDTSGMTFCEICCPICEGNVTALGRGFLVGLAGVRQHIVESHPVTENNGSWRRRKEEARDFILRLGVRSQFDIAQARRFDQGKSKVIERKLRSDTEMKDDVPRAGLLTQTPTTYTPTFPDLPQAHVQMHGEIPGGPSHQPSTASCPIPDKLNTLARSDQLEDEDEDDGLIDRTDALYLKNCTMVMQPKAGEWAGKWIQLHCHICGVNAKHDGAYFCTAQALQCHIKKTHGVSLCHLGYYICEPVMEFVLRECRKRSDLAEFEIEAIKDGTKFITKTFKDRKFGFVLQESLNGNKIRTTKAEILKDSSPSNPDEEDNESARVVNGEEYCPIFADLEGQWMELHCPVKGCGVNSDSRGNWFKTPKTFYGHILNAHCKEESGIKIEDALMIRNDETPLRYVLRVCCKRLVSKEEMVEIRRKVKAGHDPVPRLYKNMNSQVGLGLAQDLLGGVKDYLASARGVEDENREGNELEKANELHIRKRRRISERELTPSIRRPSPILGDDAASSLFPRLPSISSTSSTSLDDVEIIHDRIILNPLNSRPQQPLPNSRNTIPAPLVTTDAKIVSPYYRRSATVEPTKLQISASATRPMQHVPDI